MILLHKDKVDEFNKVKCDRITLKAPILAKINLLLDKVHQPHNYKMFSYLTEKGSQTDRPEVIFRLRW